MAIYKERNCKLCNSIFIPTSPKQKYCIDCKDLANKQAQAERDKKRNRLKHNIEYTKQCPACNEFFTTYNNNKKYCGKEECEQFRCKLKNTLGHPRRDKAALLEKGRKYYINNAEKCRLSKAISYRKDNPEAKKYIPRGKYRNSFEEVSHYIEDRGYKLISKEYINNRSKITLQCPEGHIYETNYHSFRDNGGVQGNRCPICYQQNNFVSRPEQIVRDFIRDNLPNIKVEYNNRTVISPKELDLYFPDKNLAVEVCGLYWHGELSSGKSKDYHYNKMMNCYKKGIRLITIFEDELYDHREIVLAKIRQALEEPLQIIDASECKAVKIKSKVANDFYSKYHIQGKTRALISYGLYYNNILVFVGSLGQDGERVVLKRLCSLPNISIICGATRVFKLMLEYASENNIKKIISYCDMRYTNIFKPVYEELGFVLLNKTKYIPHYFKKQKRYRNTDLDKLQEKHFKSTDSQDYDRVWDCGHRTYIYVID